MKNYEEMTNKELKEIAKARHISNWWNLRKDQLITALKESDAEEFDDTPIEITEPAEIEIDDTSTEVTDGEKVYKDEPIPPKETSTIIPKRGQLIEFNGKAQNICTWAKELGISANTLYGRLYKLGWPVERAFQKGGER